MEETDKRFILPTLSRAKISHNLSYPVGAEQVTTALSTVPQLSSLKLHFYSSKFHPLRSGHYEFLRIEYLDRATPAEKWPLSSLFLRPAQHRWEIVVQPVPRFFGTGSGSTSARLLCRGSRSGSLIVRNWRSRVAISWRSSMTKRQRISLSGP